MKILLLNHTNDPEFVIGQMAGICYGSQSDDREKNIKRAAHCVDKGHLATLRFAHATFHVSGISRACSHQFVRSKHLDFLQRSQRYCDETKSDIVIPDAITNSKQLKYFNTAIEMSYAVYTNLLAEGVKKEDARMVLPTCSETELIVTGNFQAWADFIKLRSGSESQWEIRNVANDIRAQLRGIAPSIFGETNATR
jgi:thymidylate synthase (FAD)